MSMPPPLNQKEKAKPPPLSLLRKAAAVVSKIDFGGYFIALGASVDAFKKELDKRNRERE